MHTRKSTKKSQAVERVSYFEAGNSTFLLLHRQNLCIGIGLLSSFALHCLQHQIQIHKNGTMENKTLILQTQFSVPHKGCIPGRNDLIHKHLEICLSTKQFSCTCSCIDFFALGRAIHSFHYVVGRLQQVPLPP